MIVLDQENRIFTLHTRNTTYQMKADQYNSRSFSPNPNEAGSNRDYSLDVIPQEYSTCGVGDFRLPSIELELPNGSHTADLRYEGFSLEKGKYMPEGLPGFYSATDEAETLVISLKDSAAQVAVENSRLVMGSTAHYFFEFATEIVKNRYKHPTRWMGDFAEFSKK